MFTSSSTSAGARARASISRTTLMRAHRVDEADERQDELRLAALQVTDEVIDEGVAVELVLGDQVLGAVLADEAHAGLGEHAEVLGRHVLGGHEDATSRPRRGRRPRPPRRPGPRPPRSAHGRSRHLGRTAGPPAAPLRAYFWSRLTLPAARRSPVPPGRPVVAPVREEARVRRGADARLGDAVGRHAGGAKLGASAGPEIDGRRAGRPGEPRSKRSRSAASTAKQHGPMLGPTTAAASRPRRREGCRGARRRSRRSCLASRRARSRGTGRPRRRPTITTGTQSA